MSEKRRILGNSTLNLVAGISQRFGQVFTFILVARLLTAEATGEYKLAITYTSIILALSLWGLDQILIREVAKDKSKVGNYLNNFIVLRIVAATAVWLLLFLLMPLFPYAPEAKLFILVMAATILPASLSNLYQSVWVAFENMKLYTLILLSFSILRLTGAAFVLFSRQALMPIAYIFLAVAVAEMLANAWITHRKPEIRHSEWNLDIHFALHNLKIAFPLIAASFILTVEYQFDDVILSFFRPESEVGIYGTAAMFFTLLLFLPRSFQLAIFPIISRAYQQQVNLSAVYSQSMKFMVVFCFPIALFVSLFAAPMIQLVFGSEYRPAGPILSVLAWAFFISAINVANSRLMIAADKQRMVAVFALVSMLGNVLLSLWLVPRLGGMGTAWARVLTMPLYTIPAFVYVQRKICRLDWHEFFRLDAPLLQFKSVNREAQPHQEA